MLGNGGTVMTHAIGRRALGAAALLPLCRPAPGRAANAWPNRPVRLFVGFTAGSSTDVTARLFAQRYAELWGQPVVVENIPGSGGALGVERLSKQPADGYSLMWGANGALTIVPSLQTVGFDPLKDLAPIAIVLSMPSVYLVPEASPFRGMQDVIAAARAKPGALSYGTPGVGTPQHIATEMLCRSAGVTMEHIPYRGANLADVLSGVLNLGVQNAGAAMPMVREGRLRCLGVSSLQRSPNLKDWPTVAEQGFPGFEAISWFGPMAPAGTPAEVIARVNADSNRILGEPAIRERLAVLGLDPVGGTPEAMRATMVRDIPKWASVIREANIRAN
jgi:tripartite-type tricarboxylate transporter receptor subunit TctC